MKIVTTVLAGLALATAAFAGPDDDIMARQALMKQVGASGKVGDLAALADAAEQALVAFKIDTTGQGSVDTKAKDNIWTDMAGFEALMNDMITAARAGDNGATFAQCKACHSTYRN